MIGNLIERTVKGQAEAARELFKSSLTWDETLELFQAASSIRDEKIGRRIRIVGHQGNVSPCSVNPPCRFCSLSSSISKYRSERISVLLETIVKNSMYMVKRGAVALLYGGGISPLSGKIAVEIARAVKKITDVEIYFNVGPIPEHDVSVLKDLGVRRFVISLETLNREAFSDARPGDSYDEKIKFIELLAENGLGVSVILMNGVGSDADLIDSIISLREYKNLSGIRLSTFNPVPGTPWENREQASIIKTLRACAIARLMYPEAVIDLAAGTPDGVRPLSFIAGCGNEVIGIMPGKDRIEEIRREAGALGFSVE